MANKADHELIWNLYCTKYYGMNITFFCERLEKNENIKSSEGLVHLIFKKYIQKFNEQFAVRKGIKSVQVKLTKEQIDSALVTIAKRTVDCGNGIRLNNKYYGTFDSYGNQIFIKPKTRVSVITMMNEAVYAMHDDKLLALDIIPDRKKISDRMDFDMEKPVIRKRFCP